MNLAEILKDTQYGYEIIQHEKPILTREEGSDFLGIEVGQTAPTLILKTDQGFLGAIISGSREKINFDKLADLLNYSKVELASPKEVRKTTGFDVGSVALIGFGLPCVADRRLFGYDFIYGGTGQSTSTLKIEPQALTELNQVLLMFD